MKYKLLKEDSRTSLEDAVNRYIKKGWEPIGGASHVVLADYDQVQEEFTQAIIKKCV